MLSSGLVFTLPYQAEWEDVDLADPSRGEILTRTRRVLISTGTELTAYAGIFRPTHPGRGTFCTPGANCGPQAWGRWWR